MLTPFIFGEDAAHGIALPFSNLSPRKYLLSNVRHDIEIFVTLHQSQQWEKLTPYILC